MIHIRARPPLFLEKEALTERQLMPLRKPLSFHINDE